MSSVEEGLNSPGTFIDLKRETPTQAKSYESIKAAVANPVKSLRKE